MIGHITYLSDEQMEEKFGRAAARGPQVLVRARVPDRVVPALPGREVRRVLRREHLPAHHQGARLLRSGARDRRRPRARARAGDVPVPGRRRSPPTGASRRRARARSSRRWSTTGATSSYAEIDAPHGHDAFLLDDPQYHARRARVFRPHRAATSRLLDVPRSAPSVQAQASRERDAATRSAPTSRRSPAGSTQGAQRARPGLRRRQPARLPRARARRDAATASRSTTPACSRASRNGINVLQSDLESGLAGLRRRVVRLRDPVADAAGDAPHRGDRRRDAARRPRGDRHVSRTSATGRTAGRSCAGRMPVSDSAALPVVRHAEHPPVHGRRLRRVPRASAAASSRTASCSPAAGR